MPKQEQKILDIYSGKVARKYDFSMPPFFMRWKRKAFSESALKPGDAVLVFCCGTGLDFAPILKKIGPEGHILGVDFSTEMLKSAQQKIDKNNWNHVDLVQADITRFHTTQQFDVAVCTLGLSIIPDYQQAYDNLTQAVKPGGQIIIGDMQLATGWRSWFNPVTLQMASKFGGSQEGHRNSRKICRRMSDELSEVKKREFFLGAYFYCLGLKT